MLLKHLPPINNVFSMLLRHEKQFIIHIEDDKLLGNIFKPFQSFPNLDPNLKAPKYGHGIGLKMRTFRNKNGHTVEVCFKKHILPLTL